MKTLIKNREKVSELVNLRLISSSIYSIIILLLIAFTIGIGGCEGTTGTEGPQGPQGATGPIGPAGEDGSMMYAGPGTPADDVGSTGDYYLNTITGEFYGPKDASGWGKPIIVLMGEDGEDGTDGSQIYSGTVPPDKTLGQIGDYYLNRSNYDLFGPKTKRGWGAPLNLKGADGNANVTRYLFPGHDFSSEFFTTVSISNISKTEMQQSAWLIYIRQGGFNFLLPGYGSDGESRYHINYYHPTDAIGVEFLIRREEGPGEEYDEIEIIRIETSNTVDLTSVNNSLIPEN